MKIAVYPAKTDWAFGQIYRAIKKYSKLDITLLDTEDDLSILSNFDLIHILAVINFVRTAKKYPNLASKMCLAVHSIAELYNYDPLTDQKRETSAKEIDSKILPANTITFFNRIRNVAVVSDELRELISKQTTARVFKIPCGVDPDIFKSEIIEHEKLTVLCPMAKSYMPKMEGVHGYNVKRYDLILELEKINPEIKFIYPDKLLSIDEIAEFYKKGDIILNFSHSEGNPLGIMEAGAMGVLPITTSVGIVPEIINDKNGLVVKSMEQISLALTMLNSRKERLIEYKREIKKTILETRTWDKLIGQWDQYFTDLVNQKVLVEIGSNCFETLVQKVRENWTGVMVEPVKEYFDLIPRTFGISYEQIAIGTKTETRAFAYLSNETVIKNNLPQWARGLGSFGIHPTILKHGWEKLAIKYLVPAISLKELLQRNFIDKIDFLKIDTEGFDCEILRQVNLTKVKEIQFEHVLCNPEELKREQDRLIANGFYLTKQGDNIIAQRKTGKIAVCIATSTKREEYYQQLLEALKLQTFKDFKIYTVKDIKPIGRAKRDVVRLALKDNPEFIAMIDDDDIVSPTYLEECYKTITEEKLDWVSTWGQCAGERTGFIHGYDLPLATHRSLNRLNSWAMFRSSVFLSAGYRKQIVFGEDWDLWLQLKLKGFKGRVIEKELYFQRWHGENLNKTEKYDYRTMRKIILDYNNLPEVKKRFHIPAYVHLPCSERYMACAFTQKIVKLSKMLLSQGHEVYIYGSEGSDIPCTEFIQTHTLADIRREWGDGDNRFEIGYDWHLNGFRVDFNSKKTQTTLNFYKKCIEEINKRKLPDDYLLIMQGAYHQPIAREVKLYMTCEPGIGYRGSVEGNFRAFESSYMQNFTYGSFHPFQSINGGYYDRVIPNYFDKKDFTVAQNKGDYYLYIGRLIIRKGVDTAIKATQAIGAKLYLVGQTDPELDVKKLPPHCQYLGYADAEKRKKLMSEAIAVFTPTTYLECFGGTHVEAMLSGTPPITTNFGVFPETIPDNLNGIVGFRCNTLQDFVDAAIKAKTVDKWKIAKYAERFWNENVAKEFEKWFDDIFALYESTVDPKKLGWHRLRKI